jgi:nitroimidazol reductase NimA-like FMN-containing flavoprotein (pyridoxamine 5'-phosphate oxidase superfamily)
MSKDEPVLGSGFRDELPREESDDPNLPERIRRMTEAERFAVLSTQGEGQPYASLIAFAVSADLATVVFATPITTRKYNLLVQCDHVALLIDSRSQGEKDMMKLEAFTATGRARQLEAGPDWDRCAELLIAKHPQLASFVHAPTSALFRVDIVRYFHVGRFQEVRQWRPARSG